MILDQRTRVVREVRLDSITSARFLPPHSKVRRMAGAAAGIGCTVLAFWLLNLTVRPAPIGPGHVLQFPWFIVIPAIFFVGVVLTWQNLTGHLWFILEVRTTSSRVTHPFSIRRLGNGDVHRLTEELNRALRERMRGPTQPTSASVSEP